MSSLSTINESNCLRYKERRDLGAKSQHTTLCNDYLRFLCCRKGIEKERRGRDGEETEEVVVTLAYSQEREQEEKIGEKTEDKLEERYEIIETDKGNEE